MIDWHERSERLLGELHGSAGNATYQAFQAWLEALYEQEKDGLALCDDPERLMFHWLRLKGLRELMQMLELEP